MRLKIVGVIGYSAANFEKDCDPKTRKRISDDAQQLGNWLATLGVHLLTGGGGGVMAEACKGFSRVGSRHGLVLGIIPSKTDQTALTDCTAQYEPKAGYPNDWVEVPIYTQLKGTEPKSPKSRNIINALTCDLIIAFPGGDGTLADSIWR